MSTEREKALKDALTQIDRQFGQAAVMKLLDKEFGAEMVKSNSEEIVIDWVLSRSGNQPWEGQVTIGYKWEKPHNHVAINVKDLAKVVAKLNLQRRVARYKAAMKNLKDFPVPLSAKK